MSSNSSTSGDQDLVAVQTVYLYRGEESLEVSFKSVTPKMVSLVFNVSRL